MGTRTAGSRGIDAFYDADYLLKGFAINMHVVFFIYHNNDLDQSTPVIWRLLNEGHKVTGVLLDSNALTPEQDPRLKLLHEGGNFSLTSLDRVFGFPGAAWLTRQKDGMTKGLLRRAVRKLLRVIGITTSAATRFLRSIDADVCVFEWGGLVARNRFEMLIAAQKLGLKTLCLPHGVHVLLDLEINPRIAEAVQSGENLREAYNVYDYFVFQASYHRDNQIRLGMDPDICRVLGSARYCPEWLEVNDRLYPDFVPQDDAAGKLKVVLMIHSWGYNVARAVVLQTFEHLIGLDWIYLVIKEPPRASAYTLPEPLRRKIEASPCKELVRNEISSTSLMRWSDVVINYGSSIAIEAVSKNTPVVNPTYFQSNVTVYEATGASHTVATEAELIETLRQFHEEGVEDIPRDARRQFIQSTVYGGHEPFDVLGAYVDVILGNYSDEESLVQANRVSD